MCKICLLLMHVASSLHAAVLVCNAYFVISKNIYWYHEINYLLCESRNPSPEIFWHFFPTVMNFYSQILHVCYTFLSTLDYEFLFNYLQLWRNYTILISTTIMCSKCPPSIERHSGWLHLIWHNFVIVGDNWIKICNLAYIWTFNRRVKFGVKILICFGKMSENASVRFGLFRLMVPILRTMWSGWSRLIWHNFANVADNLIKIRSFASIATHNRHVKFGW